MAPSPTGPRGHDGPPRRPLCDDQDIPTPDRGRPAGERHDDPHGPRPRSLPRTAAATPPTTPTSGWRTCSATRALAWVRERNAQSREVLEAWPQFNADARPAARHPRLEGADPRRRAPRRLALELLARRPQPARPVAPHHAGRIPQAATRVGRGDRPRRAGQGRERELGLARHPLPRAGVRALPGDAVARRLRRAGRARVRHRPGARSSPTASCCPRPSPASTGSTPTRSTSPPTSAPAASPTRAIRAWSSAGRAARRWTSATTMFEGEHTDVAVGHERRRHARLRAHHVQPLARLLHLARLAAGRAPTRPARTPQLTPDRQARRRQPGVLARPRDDRAALRLDARRHAPGRAARCWWPTPPPT